MRWFRDNVRHGSWLALIALAVNVALSFGHIHGIGGRRSEHGLIVAAIAPDSRHTPDSSDDGKADNLCPTLPLPRSAPRSLRRHQRCRPSLLTPQSITRSKTLSLSLTHPLQPFNHADHQFPNVAFVPSRDGARAKLPPTHRTGRSAPAPPVLQVRTSSATASSAIVGKPL
jgi:hypothetical protein